MSDTPESTTPESTDHTIVVDDTGRFAAGQGCWGPDGPELVVRIIDEQSMIVRPIRSFIDLLATA